VTADRWPSDRLAVVTAVSAAAGALVPDRRSLALGALVALMGALGRWTLVAPAVVALAVSGLAQRSLDGLDGVEPAVVAGEVTLLTDPVASFGGVRADVRVQGRRLEARADGVAARALGDRLAGEVVRLRGEVAPLGAGDGWLRSRHISGRLRVLAVVDVDAGHPVARLANGLRRTLVAGTGPLDARERSLFTGLVLGDDREQPADLADAFQGAGLTHLLAVSGQNVAFALALAGPLLRRLRLWPRLLATLAVIGLFGVMTRFEPSVLRASAMAALAALLATAGRPVTRLRTIALAVTGLLVVDPLLVGSVGFQLSVGAATAIVLAAPRLAAGLPGPAGLREALGVTLAAQLGVAPVLLASFGPIPVASVPANLLAVPVAGLVMVWGLTGGMLAGLTGEPAPTLLHGPTRLALGWLDLVARWSSRARLGGLGPAHVGLLALGLGAVAVSAARPVPRGLRSLAWAAAAGPLLAAGVAAHAPPPLRSTPMAGVVRWHDAGADVVVLGGAGGRNRLRSGSVLAALRREGVREIDLLVVADASVPAAVVGDVRRVHPTGSSLLHRTATDPGRSSAEARAPTGASVVQVGHLTVRLVDAGERLVVEAAARPP
jgi:competence protein ComEC